MTRVKSSIELTEKIPCPFLFRFLIVPTKTKNKKQKTKQTNDCILFNIIKFFLCNSIVKEGIICHPVLRSLLL